jgi:COP9 signalosome complex subunit 1
VLSRAADHPKLDLEIYIANYRGRTRLDRLSHIAVTSPSLSQDAFRLAIEQVKQGIDVEYYMNLASGLQKLNPDDSLATVDMAWVDQTTKESRSLTERLEGELKAYKNNLIKESIRVRQISVPLAACCTGPRFYLTRHE